MLWRALVLLAALAFIGGPALGLCIGDCNGDCEVTIDELLTGVNVVLGVTPITACAAYQPFGDREPAIPELIQAVNTALNGCLGGCYSVCGDALLQAGEECDDGGICIGGSNAGTACTAESQCEGGGVCADGAKNGYACAGDADCPSSRCVRCKTFGGDGCAANCTLETHIPMQLVPGQISANGIAPGTSGSVVGGDNLVFPLPLNGSQILTVGKARNGRVPMVVSAGSTHFAPAPLSTLGAIGCLCWRGVTAKTCGGTLFEADGTESIDCTPVFTMGDAVCSGKSPCTPVYGAGNAAAGIVGCEGLDGVNLWVTYDAGGSRGGRVAPVIQLAGTGGPGSAALLSRVALGSKGDNQCARTDAAYGPDQVFCTGDDPLRYQGGSFTMPLVTGTAAGEVANANGIDGRRLGPFQVTGASFSCAAVGRGEVVGAALAGASTVPLGSFGDAVITNQVVAAAPTVPTRSATPTATRPRPSPTPVVEVAVGSATGKPGDQVSIAITLHTSGVLVSTVSSTVTVGLNDIAFVGCTLNPELPKYLGISVSTLFVQTIVSDPDTFSRVPIPDGAVLYTCTLDIGAGALSGTTELSIQSIVVYSTGDAEIPARGGNGAIVVEGEATATPQPTLTPTPTLRPAAPAIVAGVATGRPGDTVTIEVGVRTGGRRVSMAEHDLSYDGLSVPFIARVGGAPDCTANPAVAATTSSFAFLGTRFTGTLRAAVASNNNAAGFADGALLYTCRAEISGVSVPAAYPLQVSQVTLKDPAGAQLSDAVGVDGAILVSAP